MNGDVSIVKPTSDLFTAVLWSAPKNEPILRSFINAVLIDAGQTPIAKATVLNPFNIKEFASDKTIILDVRAVDDVGRYYDLEVQVAPQAAFENRVLYYWANIYSSQLKAGVPYQSLRPAISIIVTEFPIFSGLDHLHNIFHIASKENSNVVLTDHLQIHFVRLSEAARERWDKVNALDRELRDWVKFFVMATQKTEDEMTSIFEDNPIIMEAYAELQRFSANPEMQERARQRQRFIDDYRIMMGGAREEGLAEGKAEGLEEGRFEGEQLAILTVLKARFGILPSEFTEKVYAVKQGERLIGLTVVAATCASLDDFSKVLE